MERAREESRARSPAAGGAAVALGVVFCAALVAVLVLRLAAGDLGFPDVVAMAPMIATQAVGLLIATRRPENRMGWILCALGLILALQAVLTALHLEVSATAWWFTAALWIDGKSFLLLWGAVIAVLLHFPTGTLPSRRWRSVRTGAAGAVLWGVVSHAIAPGPLAESLPAGIPNPPNPTAIAPDLYQRVAFLQPVGLLVLVAALVAALASLVVRYRSSHATERLQIRWVVAACVVFVGAMLVNVVVRHLVPGALDAADALAGGTFTLIPLSVGVAILRRRLYDIDRVINRTVVYTALTVVLGAAYLGLVTAMRAATEPVTGDSALAVAASTLAVAALFQPVRRRIQDAVDQRFNRARYDAATTIRQFSSSLRDEVDLETLQSELVALVRTTMQPASVGLWLRKAQA